MLFVIIEEQKYKAYTYNVAGFAMMTPLGKIVLDYYEILQMTGPIVFVINFLVSIFLFIAGLTFIELGRSILDEKRRHFNANRSS